MRPQDRQALTTAFAGSVFPSELVLVAEGVPAFVKAVHLKLFCVVSVGSGWKYEGADLWRPLGTTN